MKSDHFDVRENLFDRSRGLLLNTIQLAKLLFTAQLVKQSSPSSVKSARPSPDQSTSHRTSSPNIPSKHTSPSVITKTSPIVTLTSTVGSGGAVEPFYLGGDHSRLVIGGANSPVTARSPAAEESVSSPVMIRSPYSKVKRHNDLT